MKKKVSSEHHYKKSKSMKKFSMKAIMMLIPATLSSSSDMNISNAPTPSSPRNHPPEVIKTRSTPTCVTHLDYVNDTGEPRGTMIDLRLRRHMTEIPVSEPPHFLLKFQETVEVGNMGKSHFPFYYSYVFMFYVLYFFFSGLGS